MVDKLALERPDHRGTRANGSAPASHQIDVCPGQSTFAQTLGRDVRKGLASRPKYLLPKYFYDPRGSTLFESITRLPEYYLTRVEERLIAEIAPEVMNDLGPQDLVELGPGSSGKIRHLLGAANGKSAVRRYVPFDVGLEAVEAAALSVTSRFPGVHVQGVVGDFQCDLDHVPRASGRRLAVIFGSTIGNLDGLERSELLVRIRRLLGAQGGLLLGLDLVKDTAVLEAAYNDDGGVTAEFNRNILRVINRALDADFDPKAFGHKAFYNETEQRIEMHLVSSSAQSVRLERLRLDLHLEAGERIWTESSYKFTRDSARDMLRQAGLSLDRWYSDESDMFALVLARPS